MSSAQGLHHVGSYVRPLPVTLERMYENALDWEHLPWLHSGSFSTIECEEAGDWGWRARVGLAPKGELRLELRLDRSSHRWITRTLEGPGEGTEIWTHAIPREEGGLDVVVDFFVPGIEPDAKQAVGAAYRSLYARLYDEDERMMTDRQEALDQRAARGGVAPGPLVLGAPDEVRARLPLEVEHGGVRVRIIEEGGEWLAFRPICPHWLGPLTHAPVEQGRIRCPWHGYEFDLRSRRCTSGPSLRLLPAPELRLESGQLVLVASAPE